MQKEKDHDETHQNIGRSFKRNAFLSVTFTLVDTADRLVVRNGEAIMIQVPTNMS